MNRVLYIAGYGRSGSTVLERVLAASPDAVGVGEASNLTRAGLFTDHELVCTCGAAVAACAVWGRVLAEVPPGPPSSDGARRLLGSSPEDPYLVWLRRLYDALFAAAPGPDRFVVDSSKTTRKTVGRARALADAGLDVRVIHLVRDPRAAAFATRKGDNLKLEAGVDPTIPFAVPRTAASWTVANAAVGLLGLPTLRVHYEQLVEDPEATLRAIGAFSGLDVAPCIAAVRAGDVPAAHQLAGNRNRKVKRLVLTPDRRWETGLRRRDRAVVGVIAGLLARRYGYR